MKICKLIGLGFSVFGFGLEENFEERFQNRTGRGFQHTTTTSMSLHTSEKLR